MLAASTFRKIQIESREPVIAMRALPSLALSPTCCAAIFLALCASGCTTPGRPRSGQLQRPPRDRTRGSRRLVSLGRRGWLEDARHPRQLTLTAMVGDNQLGTAIRNSKRRTAPADVLLTTRVQGTGSMNRMQSCARLWWLIGVVLVASGRLRPVHQARRPEPFEGSAGRQLLGRHLSAAIC